MNIHPLLGGLLLLGAQTAFLAACSSPPVETVSYRPCDRTYAAEGSITPDEMQIMRWLAWPQTYSDLTGAIGYPAHRTNWADFYQLEGTEQWVIIYYQEKTATGFKVSSGGLECSP